MGKKEQNCHKINGMNVRKRIKIITQSFKILLEEWYKVLSRHSIYESGVDKLSKACQNFNALGFQIF